MMIFFLISFSFTPFENKFRVLVLIGFPPTKPEPEKTKNYVDPVQIFILNIK